MEKKPIVLAVMAHPDDAELKCFGTLCKYIEDGYKCMVLIICGGENGIALEDRKKMRVERISKSLRFEEAKTAFNKTKVLIKTLGFSDGDATFNRDLIVAIEEELRLIKPQVVITHYPDSFGVDHQDHSSIGRATINCATRSGFVRKIMLCEPQMALRANFVPNCFVNISEFFDKKVYALSSHKSQKGRYYLEKEYHEIRSSYYASNVGYDVAKKRLKYEPFHIIYSVEE